MTSQTLNGPALTAAALKESDQEAFHRLLAGMLQGGVNPSSFEHGPVTVTPDSADHATIEVAVARSKAHISLWGYQDSITLRYRRVSLEALKSRYGSVIRADVPISKKDLMAIYFHENQLHDRSEQIVDEPVESLGSVALAMQPDQFLLHGQTSFTVKPFQRQLSAVIANPVVPGFRTLSDFDAEPIELLVNQLGTVNADTLPYPLQPDLLVFSAPTLKGGYALDNTSITVTGFGDGYYLGSRELTYTRHDFGWSTGGNQHYVEGPSQPLTSYMVERVNALTGFPITLDDVVIESYDVVPTGELMTLTIFFKPDCLRYAGELTIDYRAI